MILLKKIFRTQVLPMLTVRPLNPLAVCNFSSLNITTSKEVPALKRKPDEILIKQWWSQTPFDEKVPLTIPIINFSNGEYSGQNVELDGKIFNQPLRRDIIHNVYHWRMNLYKVTTHQSRTKGTVKGSGKKPFKQKGTGRARQGNLRAPGRKKGGKAHGPVPRDFSYTMPQKVILQGMKAMLSAKLAEGKITIVDEEKIDEGRTKLLSNILKNFGETTTILLVGGYKFDENFDRASKNIKRLKAKRPHELDILDLLRNEKLILTLEGLKQVTLDLNDKTNWSYSGRIRPARATMPSELEKKKTLPEQEQKANEQTVTYDPKKPLEFKFKILEDYLKAHETIKSNSGIIDSKEKKKEQTK